MPKNKKPTKPTPKQIKKEADTLEKIKPSVLHFSMFGDDHHKAIDFALKVMRENLSMDAIYDNSCDEGENPEDMGVEFNAHQRDQAIETRRWMDGEAGAISPVNDYKGLVQKGPTK